MKVWTLLLGLVSLTGCLGMPQSVTPVDNFQLDRYLGTWYEIARLDHSFERGLSQVTAEYRLRPDGGVDVINRGFSAETDEWRDAHGKAYFVESPNKGYLKVSFFGPFYGSYVVFELESENYDYAFVSGPNHDYLWLLARSPNVAPEVITEFKQRARQHGFATDELIYVSH
ncbi:lipocalin [Vibrio sp. SM6]|uniref:Outer membrane lipoprotein Blc n=1 Tax=Vibrio agarilyticus TaxID=2726741 RepID=A0A7X8YGR8_9VIBR|nr:lipocalin family protein [Vibrio agarilyticus]NLS12939.1 lipocalin [Vibrio agarilyticus]